MKPSENKVRFFLLIMIVLMQGFAGSKALASPKSGISPYTLIDAVNNLRTSTGVSALNPNSNLMAAAQGHSEFQAAIGSWSHIGAGGTDETARALAAGYGGGANVFCDEAVAVANSSYDADYIINTLWNDYTHRDLVLRNTRYVDIGAGAAESNGLVYYTVDVCTTGSGSAPAAAPAAPGAPGLATSTRPVIMAIETALPEEDGSIIHLVQPGHTLWGIADAYGMTTEMVASLNGLDLKNPVVFSGQKLLVRMAFTATVSPTVTQTPRPPTRTPRPTFTPGPTRPTATASLTPKPTREPLLELPKVNTRSIGIGLVVVCALGLAAVLVSWVVRRKP